MGFPAGLHRAEFRFLRAHDRRVHRRGADVGHPVSRPARVLRLLPRGDVVAQSQQSDDQPAAPDRVRHRADGDEHHPAGDRHGAGDLPRHGVLRVQPLRPRARARGVFLELDPDQLGRRHRRVGRAAAQRYGRGVTRLDIDVRADAADLYLLSRQRAAGLAASGRLGAAADLCVRRHACVDHGTRVPRRSDDRGLRAQHRLLRRRRCRIPRAAQELAPCRHPVAGRRIRSSTISVMAGLLRRKSYSDAENGYDPHLNR